MRPLYSCLPIVFIGAAFGAKDSVISRALLEFPNALAGKVVEIRKVVDGTTGSLKFESNAPEISNPGDLVRMEQEEKKAERIKYGALGGAIQKKFDAMKDQDLIRVQIMLRIPDDVPYYDKTKGYSEALLREQSLAAARLNPVVSLQAFEARHGLSGTNRQNYGRLICGITKSKLRKLMYDPDVASVVEYQEPEATQSRV